jgi:membrane-bound ClpP family serine protease
MINMLKKVSVLFYVLSLLGIASSAGAYTLMESYNASDSNQGYYWAATNVALEYIPNANYNLERVEFYTGYSNKDDVTIALRPDDNGVSFTILASGTYNNVAD